MNDRFYVYCLIDPRDNDVFYVGKGCGHRMFLHEKLVKKGILTNNNILLTKKIQSILNDNKNVIYKKLYTGLSSENAILKEINVIKSLGRVDLKTGNLFNLTDGGEGIINISQETRQKLSNSHKGIIFSEEHKNNLKLAAKNRTREHIEKIVAKNRGRKQSEETKKKISLSKKGMSVSWIKGKHHTDETKKKLSDLTKSYFSNSNNRKKWSEMMLKNPPFIKTWMFIDPNGCKKEIVNLSKFCRDMGLYYECMKQVYRGIKKSYKGWKKDENFRN